MLHDTTLISASFIVHVHYQHLLIPLHVHDRFTTSLAFGFFRSPHPVHPIGHAWSVHQYIRLLSEFRYMVRMIARHSLFLISPSCPLVSIFLAPLSVLHLIRFPLFYPLFVASFSPSHHRTVMYLLHARWQTRLFSTIYLITNTVTHPRAISERAPVG